MRILDQELYEELVEKMVDKQFHESIEKGTITHKKATQFIKTYCTFDLEPVGYINESDDFNLQFELNVKANIDFDKINHDLTCANADRIKELEKENNHLKYKLGDRTVDLEVTANEVHDTCMKKVDDLIDKKMKDVVNKHKYDNLSYEKSRFAHDILYELKKELHE